MVIVMVFVFAGVIVLVTVAADVALLVRRNLDDSARGIGIVVGIRRDLSCGDLVTAGASGGGGVGGGDDGSGGAADILLVGDDLLVEVLAAVEVLVLVELIGRGINFNFSVDIIAIGMIAVIAPRETFVTLDRPSSQTRFCLMESRFVEVANLQSSKPLSTKSLSDASEKKQSGNGAESVHRYHDGVFRW